MRELLYSASTPDDTVLETAGLVVGGESDGIFSAADLRATAKFFNAPLKLYPAAGHNLMLEPNRLEIALEILDWLGSIKPLSA